MYEGRQQNRVKGFPRRAEPGKELVQEYVELEGGRRHERTPGDPHLVVSVPTPACSGFGLLKERLVPREKGGPVQPLSRGERG